MPRNMNLLGFTKRMDATPLRPHRSPLLVCERRGGSEGMALRDRADVGRKDDVNLTNSFPAEVCEMG
jgi:hypothetical protein